MKRAIVLVSGGKDSIYALLQAQEEGFEVKKIVTVFPPPYDLFFHNPNVQWVKLQAEALKIPWTCYEYSERGDYQNFLSRILRGEAADFLVVGAIKSKYQLDILEESCRKCGLRVYSPLWDVDEDALFRRYRTMAMDIVVVSVSAMGLDQSWLGRRLDTEAVNELRLLSKSYGFNLSGEGGEYETFVLDALSFDKRIKILEGKRVWKMDHGFYHIEEAILESKGNS
ncbi:MAG: diphthine--ammonia ligase [Nitrososphaeria archaeon]|nr:diphthine--ammonia ligase [Nitrososphaeria archaeon]NIQ32241.1 diphthine--ammonia ligase [Nitrososphaeria archaeon]